MNSLVKIYFLSCISVSLFSLTGCSSTPNYLIGPKETVGETRVAPAQGQDKLIVYRAENKKDRSNDSVLVSDNNRILGGLMQGQYLDVNICHAYNNITLQTPSNTEHTVKVLPGLDHDQYIKITGVENGKVKFERINEFIAKEELANYDYQSFLTNRSYPECDVIKDVIIKEMQLGADALFKFDGYELSNILARNRLDKMLEQIKEMKLKITKIVVVGHTDRTGSVAYNQSLSEDRARTIVSYLKNNGVESEIESIGVGSSEPITKYCSDYLPREELIECLQPDRRVVVQLWGDYKKIVQ